MKEPVRILHVFGRMDRGGAETMVMNLYRSIDRKKIQFDFLIHTDSQCAYNEEIKKLGGKIYSVPRYTGINHFKYVRAWNSFFKRHREYKIIHGHVRSTASIYLKIAKKHGITTISHSHNTSSGNGISAVAKKIIQIPIRWTADYFFACSVEAGKWLFGENILKNKNFYLLKNSIQANLFKFNEEDRLKVRKEFGITNELVIGHIGRFHPQKNHEFIIEIFNEIKKTNINIKLILVGQGELKEVIQEKVKKYDLNKDIIFTGVRSDIAALLQAFDLFLMPSVHEGLPVTLIEAQASGLKCLVSDTITTDVQITNLISFLSLESPPSCWAQAINEEVANYSRIDTSDDLCKAGYDVKENTKWLEKFYTELI